MPHVPHYGHELGPRLVQIVPDLPSALVPPGGALLLIPTVDVQNCLHRRCPPLGHQAQPFDPHSLPIGQVAQHDLEGSNAADRGR